ncbi:hypothetical protein [Paraburkholderia phosphatilytica]|uniref:hypothetical protein n=1 Tax=Paraburkholderia phosphatilytica TaxID=2282883 RepID=UPI000F5EC469|nr:hypothetical protein [Paraburkholderia phosphatilytica]
MNAKEFWGQVGPEVMREVCAEAGSSYGYFKLLANGHRGASKEFAERFAEAAMRLTGLDLDLRAGREICPCCGQAIQQSK